MARASAHVRTHQMPLSLHDVHQALHELGTLRFGEMRVVDAMREIVQTTHTIFDVDGAGLMLADVEHRLRNVAVFDDRPGHLEELQIRHRKGPCITAFEEKVLWLLAPPDGIRGPPGPRRVLPAHWGGCWPGQPGPQAPSRRVRPALRRVRRFSAAHRVCSQALFLLVPM
jgi:hypothetical protein